jgi:hypothetical protein
VEKNGARSTTGSAPLLLLCVDAMCCVEGLAKLGFFLEKVTLASYVSIVEGRRWDDHVATASI